MRSAPVCLSAFLISLWLSLSPIAASADTCESIHLPCPPRYTILFIGDGIGYEHIKAARVISGSNLAFESLPFQASVITNSAGGGVTDSAAAATAMATGHKVNNTVLSLAIPGDGRPLETVLELYKRLGRGTGLLTTAYVTHATPAAFGSHVQERTGYGEAGEAIINHTKPEVLLGGPGKGISQEAARQAGYSVITSRSEMLSIDPDKTTHLFGSFGDGEGYMPYLHERGPEIPSLAEMTSKALDLLDNNEKGFFLMVEGGRIDHASHKNILKEAVGEVMDFSAAVEVGLAWAAKRSDALVIITSDHETGGLKFLGCSDTACTEPEARWAGHDHTPALVPLYATGVNASLFSGVMDNTDIFKAVFH